MKFTKVITIDWYDNILKAFCIDDDGVIYYCCVLAINEITDDKIYLRLDLKYLIGQKELLEIIKLDSFQSRWKELSDLMILKSENETYLIKSKNLLNADDGRHFKFKDNFKCPKYIIWGDFQDLWDRSEKINDWLVYKKMTVPLSVLLQEDTNSLPRG